MCEPESIGVYILITHNLGYKSWDDLRFGLFGQSEFSKIDVFG